MDVEQQRDFGPHEALANDAVLSTILSTLVGPADLAVAARTCRQWARTCSFDAVWQALYLRAYGVPDDHEKCGSFRDQYRRALSLASSKPSTKACRLPCGENIVSVAFDPITGVLATTHATLTGLLRVQALALETPAVPPPPSLGWDPHLMPLGHTHTIYSDPGGARVPRAFRPVACHSGRCVFMADDTHLRVTGLQPNSPVIGRLDLGAPEAAGLVMNSWMCVSVSFPGDAIFWSLDCMASFGRRPLGCFLKPGPGLPNWSQRIALTPEPSCSLSGNNSDSSCSASDHMLVAILSFSALQGPHVLVLRAERLANAPSTGGGRLTNLQELAFNNPTSCCFWRGRLLVGGNVTRDARGGQHFFSATVIAYDAATWDKLGMLASTEISPCAPPSRLTATPRVIALEGSVVFELPRNVLTDTVADISPQVSTHHAICAMDLQRLRAAEGSHVVLGAEDRAPVIRLADESNEGNWFEVEMLLSTPRRLLILSKLQTLLELPLC